MGDGMGPAAKGLNPKPRNFTDKKAMQKLTDEHLMKVIREGGASVGRSAAMPAHPQFSDQQLKGIVAYVRTFAGSKAPKLAKKKANQERKESDKKGVSTKADLSMGRQLYRSTCAACHGSAGDGRGPAGASLNPPPRDFTDRVGMSRLSNAHIFKTIKYGGAAVGKSPVMPAHSQFSDGEINAIIAYVRTFARSGNKGAKKIKAAKAKQKTKANQKTNRAETKNPPDQNKKLNGNTLYASTCIACHGKKGDGRGPAGAALNPPPRDFTDAELMAKLTDEMLKKAIREGGAAVGKSPVMPPNPQFNDEELDAIVAYLRSFAKKSAEEEKQPNEPATENSEPKDETLEANEASEEVFAKGKELYDTVCLACHGQKGNGKGPAAAGRNPKPRDFTDAEYMAKLTDELIKKTIRGGELQWAFPR